MNANEIALKGAIHAIKKLQDREESIAYCIKDSSGIWNQIACADIILLLNDMLREARDAD